jgi:hypothetical protein
MRILGQLKTTASALVGNCGGLPQYGVETMMTENTHSPATLASSQPLIDLRDRPSPEILRVLAIGSPEVVNNFVMSLFRYGYARPDEWSRQLPTVNPGEVMRILTKRISLFE